MDAYRVISWITLRLEEEEKHVHVRRDIDVPAIRIDAWRRLTNSIFPRLFVADSDARWARDRRDVLSGVGCLPAGKRVCGGDGGNRANKVQQRLEPHRGRWRFCRRLNW